MAVSNQYRLRYATRWIGIYGRQLAVTTEFSLPPLCRMMILSSETYPFPLGEIETRLTFTRWYSVRITAFRGEGGTAADSQRLQGGPRPSQP